jgi:hypothetical protein
MTFWHDGERMNALLCEMMAICCQPMALDGQWTHL